MQNGQKYFITNLHNEAKQYMTKLKKVLKICKKSALKEIF